MNKATFPQFTASFRVTVRKCRRADVRALEWYGLYWGHREIIEAAFEAQERRETLILVADVNRFPAGQVWIDLVSKRRERAAHLRAVRVLPCLTGLGIGPRLLDAAETLLRERGYGRVELGVERPNARVREFYERRGYRVIGTKRDEYSYTTPNGSSVCIALDEWILRKDLPPRAEKGRVSRVGSTVERA